MVLYNVSCDIAEILLKVVLMIEQLRELTSLYSTFGFTLIFLVIISLGLFMLLCIVHVPTYNMYM